MVLGALYEENRDLHIPSFMRKGFFSPASINILFKVEGETAILPLDYNEAKLGNSWHFPRTRVIKVSTSLSFVCLIAVGYPYESPQKDGTPLEEVTEFLY